MDSQLITATEAASILQVKMPTLYCWTSQRKIPFVRIARNMIRFRRSDIEAWIAARDVAVISSPKPAA